MLATTITAGLAAYTLWHAIARKQPPGIRQAYAALPDPIRYFVGCPWCFGAWIAAFLVIGYDLWTGHTEPATVALTVLGAAAIPGILESLIPDDGSVTD